MDLHDLRAAKYIVIYTSYGWLNGMWRTYAHWIIGSFSNDPLSLSLYGSFHKAFSAAGAAIVSNLGNRKTSYTAMFASYWALSSGSLTTLLPIVLLRLKGTAAQPMGTELKPVKTASDPSATATEGRS